MENKMVDLKDIAKNAQQFLEAAPVPTNTDADEDTFDLGGVVHIGSKTPVAKPASTEKPRTGTGAVPVPIELGDEDMSAILDSGPTKQKVIIGEITEDDVRDSVAADVPDNVFAQALPAIRDKIIGQYKSLLLLGFSAEEANEGAKNFMKRQASDLSASWLEENPDVVEVKIDKSKEAEAPLAFSPEEKAKMTKARAIRLVVVEDAELKSLPIETVDVHHRAEYMHNLRGGLARYSVPMPATGDYFSFRGAQIVQMASILAMEDEKMSETLMRKAQLLYDKFIDGTLLHKNEHPTWSELSFEDFCNKVAYSDVDMGLFGILCAGQMEEAETEMECHRCKQTWKHGYNVKKLLSMDGFSDFFKNRTDQILGNCTNVVELEKLGGMQNGVRYKSPFTKNVYDIEVPSIAKANRVFMHTDKTNPLQVYISALAIYMHKVYIYNENTGKYAEVNSTDGDIPTLLDTLLLIPDEDSKLLLSEINDKYVYTPTFKMTVHCPRCGNTSDLNLAIDQLVFQRAQDTYTVTTQ